MEIDENSLVRCRVCEAVNWDSDIYCHRCESKVYIDNRGSINRAWAFLVTALIFYIPANVYPILVGEQFGNSSSNTIAGGIYLLWEEGEYPIAVVILVASVLVPILKFIMLIYLLINANLNRRAKINPHKVHYLTEIIGPWSMVDVFVVAILTGLVQMTAISIIAGPGATAFVLMVLFTMFAALSIDTRILKGVE